MKDPLKKFRDRLRITIILYTFSDFLINPVNERVAEFRSEIKIQAIDFLLRYPDFLSIELIDLVEKEISRDFVYVTDTGHICVCYYLERNTSRK